MEIFQSNGLKSGIKIIAKDNGPGIPHLDEINSGGYQSKRGLGRGILGSKNIMDEFRILSAPEEGAVVTCH